MSPQRHLELAHAAHDRRDWRAAADSYEAFIDHGGEAGTVLAALGDVRLELGEVELARVAFLRLVELVPSDLRGALRLGQLAARLAAPSAARLALRQAYGIAERLEAARVEPPLQDVWALQTYQALHRTGWFDRSAVFASLNTDTYGLDEAFGPIAEPLRLRVIAPSPEPSGRPPQLVLAIVVDLGAGDSRATARRAADLAGRTASGRSMVIVLVTGPSADRTAAEAAALLHETYGLGAPLLVLAAAPGHSARALINVALAAAASCAADALVLTGEWSAQPAGLAAALTALSADPMAGFVGLAGDAPVGAQALYAPPTPASALLIAARVLAEAGGLDAVYDDLHTALLDLALRANRLGFSFLRTPALDEPGMPRRTAARTEPGLDRRIFNLRYPEHGRAARAFARGDGAAERLSRPRAASSPSLLLDLTGLRAHHDGTSELSVRLAQALVAADRRSIRLWCSADAADFHGLPAVVGFGAVTDSQAEPAVPSACLRIGQPLGPEDLARTWSAAPIAGFLMLDAISLDVMRLDAADLRPLWRLALGHSELCGWLSDFTRDQMRRRFGPVARPGAFTALCSTATDEYAALPSARARVEPGGLLLVGNAFDHKNISATVATLRARWPLTPLTVLGPVLGEVAGVTWVRSGAVPAAELAALYALAEIVVFPSLYEGFGLPIMHALAHGRAVMAIDSPVFRELASRCALGRNLHLFSTTAELAEGVAKVRLTGFLGPDRLVRENRWADSARAVLDAVDRAAAAFDPHALSLRMAVARAVAGREGEG